MDKSLEVIIKSAEVWLSNPAKKGREEALLTASELVAALTELMKENDTPRQLIGPVLAQVKGVQKSIANLEMMDWVGVEEGHVAIGHRPGAKLGADLKLQRATHILTLLSEGEQAKSIQSIATKNGLGWLWFPMASAQPPGEDRYKEVADLFGQMKGFLNEGGKIYMHCSAGIHRTGMISNAFLRFLGKDAQEAMSLLKSMRLKTSEEVGEERIAWGNEVADKLSW